MNVKALKKVEKGKTQRHNGVLIEDPRATLLQNGVYKKILTPLRGYHIYLGREDRSARRSWRMAGSDPPRLPRPEGAWVHGGPSPIMPSK